MEVGHAGCKIWRSSDVIILCSGFQKLGSVKSVDRAQEAKRFFHLKGSEMTANSRLNNSNYIRSPCRHMQD